MQEKNKSSQNHEGYSFYENSLKHWRRYGSWFSWGSPIGLGLFCIFIATAFWILGQTFGW